MANTRPIGVALLSLVLLAGPSQADLRDDLVDELGDEGFESIRVSRTWLGRTRIQAEGPEGTREIIFNPRTEEILRDYSEPRDRSEGRPSLAADPDAPRGESSGVRPPARPAGSDNTPPRGAPGGGDRPDPGPVGGPSGGQNGGSQNGGPGAGDGPGPGPGPGGRPGGPPNG